MMTGYVNAKGAEIKYKTLRSEYKVSDDGEGIIEAFVSIFGNVDSYGDRVMYGAFTDSLKAKMPKLVWQHRIDEPIGKTLEAIEMPAGDDRLPDHLKEYGALYTKGAFNLNVQQGREAYEHVKFGSIDEYSFGYIEDVVTPREDGTKELNKLTLIEWSLVTLGANPLTMTASVKAMSLQEKLDATATLLAECEKHASSYVDMRSKAGRVLNAGIRSLILSLADQSKELAKELYRLHKETEPIKIDDGSAKRRLLSVQLKNIQQMEIPQ